MTDLSKRPELAAYFAKGYWQCQCPGYRLCRPDLAHCPSCGVDRPSAGVVADKKEKAVEVPEPAERQPNKTELEAKRLHCPVDARYESVTFHMANGHRYTPDFVWWQDGRMYCLEAKGSYKLGSYQRARMAFDQVRTEFPDVAWVWAERRKDGTWKIEK